MKGKFHQFFFLFFLLFCLSITAFAQSVKTSINTQNILIGEQLQYSLQFTLPSNGYSVQFNVPDSFPHFEIMDKGKFDSVDAANNYLVIQRLKLTSWDSGKWAIPSFAVKIKKLSSGDEYTLNTDQIMIDVGYAPADSSGELRDIKPVMDVFYVDRSWMYIAAAVLLALVLLFFIYRYFKNRPKKQKPLFDEKLSPHEEAMKQLALLKGSSCDTAQEAKIYYTSLSDIFKKYFSRKRQQNLMNKTTGEILLGLKNENLPDPLFSNVAESLRIADAVKFARYIPPSYEVDKSWDFISNAIITIEKINTTS